MVYNDNDQLKNEIKKLLIDANTTQSTLSKDIGMSRQNFSNLISRGRLTVDKLSEILSAVGYDLEINFKKKS